MDTRRRVAQFLMVAAMAATSTAFTGRDASTMLFNEYCANSCSGTSACDPCGGVCLADPCYGEDGKWYLYSIYCYAC